MLDKIQWIYSVYGMFRVSESITFSIENQRNQRISRADTCRFCKLVSYWSFKSYRKLNSLETHFFQLANSGNSQILSLRCISRQTIQLQAQFCTFFTQISREMCPYFNENRGIPSMACSSVKFIWLWLQVGYFRSKLTLKVVFVRIHAMLSRF